MTPDSPSKTVKVCWWCNGKLTRFSSRVNAGVEITDPIGHTHRVHKICKPDAEAEFHKWKEWR